MKRIFFLLAFIMFLSSCSSYVSRIHQQMDRELGQAPRPQAPQSAIPQVNSENVRSLAPNVQRQYGATGPRQGLNSRVTAEDLRDNAQSTSLWVNSDQQLFFQSQEKRAGDIILINVMERLKNEIALELNRSFPAPRNRDQNTTEETPAPERDLAQEQEASDKVHDRISTVVMEHVSRDHMLIRGRKNLLFRGTRRLVEVQALISKNDILPDNTINSDRIIESHIVVLR